MRASSIILAGVFALASAQSTTSTVSVTTTETAPNAANSQQAVITACLNACEEGDVSCRAKCIAVPNPDSSAVRLDPLHPGNPLRLFLC